MTEESTDKLPVLDISKARAELARKQRRQLYMIPLVSFLIFCALMGTLLSIGSSYFGLIIAGWVLVIIVSVTLWLILGRRCPKCGRFWARELHGTVDAYDGPSTPIGSLGPGGSPTRTSLRVTVYQARCRYCGHCWIVLR